MIRAAWLIGEREFRTYTGTWSFWLALLLGPVLMAGAVLLATAPRPPTAFSVSAPEPHLAQAARAAVIDALRIEGVKDVAAGDAGPRLRISATNEGASLLFDRDFPLSASGRELVRRSLEAPRAPGATAFRIPPSPPPDMIQASRLAVMMMLWLSLVGSLGMLLQAVVRERANRSLETLVVAAGPGAIVVGKVAGVGAVSLLVLGTWLISAAAAGSLAPAGADVLPRLLRTLGDPWLLARAGTIYLLAYAFYGLATVAVGALARDSAAAQNLVRPLFLWLMGAFFFTLNAAGKGGSAASWEIFFPPLTPFLLLVRPAPPLAETLAMALLAVSSVAAGVLAVLLLRRVFSQGGNRPRRHG